ncbi:DEAD-domain-containing protein [Scenedesmus sp. NREL 46B-D3]|nr:DEAD-domain-containing protein [Scenedesmus sp. NREL 46B-D3]
MAETEEAVQLFSRKAAVKRKKKPQPSEEDAGDSAPKRQQQEAGAAVLPERAQGEASTSESAAASFKDLGVSDWLCSVLQSLGIRRPTQVQAGCIPAILAGKDVIGTAQTGSGKTAAFALPILQHLARDPYGIFALVLTPTRELAMQLADQFRAFGAGMSLKDTVIIGGVEQQQQAQALARRPHVVVATPGRLAALVQADGSLGAGFARLAYLVMDEADRLLDPSFEADLRVLLPLLPHPSARQSLLFSATLTPSLVKLQAASLAGAHVFQAYEGLRTADRLEEQYVFIPQKVKDVYLHHLLLHCLASLQQQQQQQQQMPGAAPSSSSAAAADQGGGSQGFRRVRSAIIFVSTCKGCHMLSLVLQELGLPAAALHSGKSQKQRLAALASFKSEHVPLLLATDVAARGLDIPSVDLVVNYDLPVLAADYVHRVGRTARAGRAGWAVSFITQYDVELVGAIEGHIGHKLAELPMEEAAVLKGITQVYKAKKAAALAAMNDEDKQAVGMGRSSGGGSRHKRSSGGSGSKGGTKGGGGSKQ